MRRLLCVIILLAGCDLPPGSLPARINLFGSATPAPNSSIVQTFLTTSRDGRPVSTTMHLAIDPTGRRIGVRLGGPSAAAGLDSLTIRSDDRGLAATTVSFGGRSGRAVLNLTAAETGARDSIIYDLPQGDVRHISVGTAPAYVGDSVTVSWSASDATFRPVFCDPTIAIDDTTIAALRGDGWLVAKVTGSSWLRASQGGTSDSTPVTVVPAGRLSALMTGAHAWTRFDLKGDPQTTAFYTSLVFADPRSSPSGDTLAFTDSGHVRLRVPGPVTSRLVPAALGFASDQQPDWSGDGQWVYFTAWFANGRSEIWRIHPDGTGAALAGPAAAVGEFDAQPSISSDGSLLAFTTNRTLAGGQPTLRITSLSNGATVYAGPAASAPRFSPSGATIAFVSGGALRLVNPDGSALRTLAPTYTQFSGQLAWSPDGRWIAVAHPTPGLGQYLHLVDVTTNTTIRLPYAFLFSMPVWR